MYLLYRTETLENHGLGSLDEGGFTKITYVRERVGTLENSIKTSLQDRKHFNLPEHELYHLKVSVLKKVWDLGRSLLKVQESK